MGRCWRSAHIFVSRGCADCPRRADAEQLRRRDRDRAELSHFRPVTHAASLSLASGCKILTQRSISLACLLLESRSVETIAAANWVPLATSQRKDFILWLKF